MKITLSLNTLSIGTDVIIDAGKKVSEQRPKGWVDPKAFQEVGNIWQELKKAYTNNKNIQDTLKELVVRNYGVKPEDIEEVQIEGGVPEHWREMRDGKMKFR